MNTLLSVTSFGDCVKLSPSFAHPLSKIINSILHRAVSRTARIDSFLRRAVLSTYDDDIVRPLFEMLSSSGVVAFATLTGAS